VTKAKIFELDRCSACPDDNQCYFCYDDSCGQISAQINVEIQQRNNTRRNANDSSASSSSAAVVLDSNERALHAYSPPSVASSIGVTSSVVVASNPPGSLGIAPTARIDKDPPISKSIGERVFKLYNSDQWLSDLHYVAEIKEILKQVFAPVPGSGRRSRPWPFPGLWVNPLAMSTGVPFVCT
jgi:hypothetical protein